MGACSGEEHRQTGLVTDTTAAAGTTLDVLKQLTVVDVLHSDGRFSTFVTALDTVGLTPNLEQQGPFTVFVPPNSAFSGTARALYAPASHDRLQDVLLYHVLDENLTPEELRRSDSLRIGTLEGDPVTIYRKNGQLVVNGVPLVNTSVTVGNGTVYVLDGALNPPVEATASRPGTPTPRGTPRQ
jgi:uncharacterized surface protein with fasciclin (FAS1) repeats